MEKIVNKLNSLTKRKAFNYLEDPLMSAYFLSTEAMAYYLSIKHVDIKRDYHAQLISSINDFLSLINETNIEILNFYIFSKNKSTSRGLTNADSSVTLESIHPEGCELLGIKLPLTHESLKICYRKAAMKYHPDRGGSHEEMLIINEAYTAYQNYLCGNFKSAGELNFENNFYAVPRDVNDYIYLLNSLLSQVYCDEWDLLNSYKIVKKLQDQEFYGSKLIETGEEVRKLVEMASTLTQRLTANHQDLEAKEIMEFTKYIYNLGKLDYKPYLEEPEKIRNGVKTLRIIINHIRQADNALSNGVISIKRYESLLRRFGKKKDIEIEKAVILKEFLNSDGFIDELVYDNGANKTPSDSTPIPEVGYYEDKKLHRLSKAQQAEYFLAFSTKSSLNLARKYIYVRLASYILSIELESSKKLIGEICNECTLFSNIFNTSQRKNSNTLEVIESLCLELKQLGPLSGLKREKKIDIIKSKFNFIICDYDSTFSIEI